MSTRFLQIHFLTHFPASLLNRDDVGLAKRLPFGGATRTRISSQCLKRHWRVAEDQWSLSSLDAGMSTRSRYIFAEKIAPVLQQDGMSSDMIVAVLLGIKAELLGESKKAKEAKGKKGDQDDSSDIDFRALLKTEQVIVLGQAEINYIIAMAKEIAAEAETTDKVDAALKSWFTRERKANLKQLKQATGLDAAMFGRMVTSDALARGDAAVHVAHAFTVHREFAETDYFSAIDDLEREEGALGSGHIGTTELTSGLFYGYVVIDVPLLASNLGDDSELAAKTIEHLVHLVAKVSPGAKLGSTAPYARAGLLLIERGSAQPRSLADSFLKPVSTNANESLVEKAVDALSTHLAKIDVMYGTEEERAFAAYFPVESIPGADDMSSIDTLAKWAGEAALESEMVGA